ncbi:MAG: ABC transporter ATP-binding protein [Actinobacteria bacterium]|nr:ABC transporter ATP-binding protein [Actinomycetota bacterium]
MARSAPTAAARVADPIFDVAGVTLRFGGVTSLADVTLQMGRGEILAIIGPNGAGKTSLFNCLTGVYRPQTGSITFRATRTELPVTLLGRKTHQINHLGIARTFQNIRLFPALTVLENVKVGLEARHGVGPISAMLGLPNARHAERESTRRGIELLRFVGLADQANTIASALSYGAQRRLEIARALGTGPAVLLLDEPAAGTNPVEKRELADLIRQINRDLRVSVLLIEHDMRLVMSVATRVIVLNFGQLIAAGTPEQIQRNPAVIEAYLGTGGQAEDGRNPGTDAGGGGGWR